MNTDLNIKTRRRLFSPNVITLLVLVVVLLVLGGPSTQAQTATDSTATTTTSADVVNSSLAFTVKGTVNDPNGAFNVSGTVNVTAKRVVATDSATTPAVVVLDLDFSGIKGTTGTGKTATVYVTGGNHATEIRPFQATDTVIVTCPYYDSTKDPITARTMLVTATLNFDVSTGKLTSGSISVGNNVVTSSAVGSFTVN